jgi:SAM-dependent methyltransferase
MRLSPLYAHRFPERELARKAAVWDVLRRHVFARWIRPDDTVLDVGAGFCEFINAVEAKRRVAVDLNPDTPRHAAVGVEVRTTPADQLGFLRDGEVDVAFTSNFFEHLPSKAALTAVVEEIFRVLRPGGRLIAMGPNIRFLPGAYWDFYDHIVPLSDQSISELLAMTGFVVEHCEPRFVPYTTKSRLPQAPWLVRAYLALRPLSSAILGKQFLVVATKPAVAPEPRVSAPRPGSSRRGRNKRGRRTRGP